GYFVAPYTVTEFLGRTAFDEIDETRPEFEETANAAKEKLDRLMAINGKRTVDWFHRKLGADIMWNKVGMSRNAEDLKAAIEEIKALREEFWNDVRVTGENEEINQSLEKANRVADFLELGELMARDALHREESCGGHFREEHQTEENEAKRDDENYAYVAAFEFKGDDAEPALHKETLTFDYAKPSQRSYK
ncbi:MAG: fumarate reductase/succinate dehydrogenase flavoprotein subunit, partial [Ignavibacteriales bacterium]|nr:fumarate reductase/succinate dehydrogenase flavoprotein subunit [Ignavibacteriales bacterium]